MFSLTNPWILVGIFSVVISSYFYGHHQVIEFRGEATADPHYQSRCREKIRCMLSDPYRKPTQVGG